MWHFNRLVLKERADYFCQLVVEEQDILSAYVDMPKFNKYWLDYRQRGIEKNTSLLWEVIALAMWLRQQRKMQAG